MDLSGSITILTTLPLVYLRLTPILCKICAGNNHLLWGKDTTKLPLIKVTKTKVQLNLGAQSKKLIKPYSMTALPIKQTFLKPRGKTELINAEHL